MTEECLVEAGEIMQSLLKLHRIYVRSVQPFDLLAAMGEVDRWTRDMDHRNSPGARQARNDVTTIAIFTSFAQPAFRATLAYQIVSEFDLC